MTSWIVNSVVPFSSMSSNAASRKRWTRTSARDLAAFRLRETARSRQARSGASSVDSRSDISDAHPHVRSRYQRPRAAPGSARRSAALVDVPTLHHETHVLGHGDVLGRIAGHRDDV